MASSNNKQLTFKVAISGITAAFVTIFLAAAYYSPFGKISFYVLAGLVLLLPLTSGSLWACAMSYLAGGALGLIFSVVGVLPYAVIFGLQIFLFGVCLKYRVKPIVSLPVKGVLFVPALYLVFSVYGISSIENLFLRIGIPYKFLYVVLILTPIYLAYDYALKYIYGWLRRRMKKATARYLHGGEKHPKTDDIDDIFNIENSQYEKDDNGNENNVEKDDEDKSI